MGIIVIVLVAVYESFVNWLLTLVDMLHEPLVASTGIFFTLDKDRVANTQLVKFNDGVVPNIELDKVLLRPLLRSRATQSFVFGIQNILTLFNNAVMVGVKRRVDGPNCPRSQKSCHLFI